MLGRAKWYVSNSLSADDKGFLGKAERLVSTRRQSTLCRRVAQGKLAPSFLPSLLWYANGKILQRFEDRDVDARRWSLEIESMGPLPRAQSTASSESSFHSSRASPPPVTSDGYYPPPDPSLPAPDVAPNIIPPSALTPSHRSLVNLPPSQHPYSDTGLAPQQPQFQSSQHGSRPQSLFGGSAPDRDHLAAFRARRQTVPAMLGYVPEASPTGPSHSQHHHQQAPPLTHHVPPPFRPSSVQHTVQQAPPPFGTGSPYPVPPPRFPSVPPGNAPYARDFGTPDLQPPGMGPGTGLPGMGGMPGTGMGMGGMAGMSPYNPSPFARPASASTFSHVHVPLNLPATLQQIHTSLQALHERLATLERTQSALLRRDERRNSSWWPFSFGVAEEDALDSAEIAVDRDQWEGYSPRAQSTTIRLRKKKGLSARIAWALITAVRRAVISLGAAVLVGSVALMFVNPRWRRILAVNMRKARLRVARALADH